MLKKSISLLVVLVAGLSTSPLMAQASQGMSGSFIIDRVNINENGFEVVPTQATNNPASCTAPTQTFRLGKTADNYAAITAGLLTAFAAGKPVRVWVYGCASDGVTTFGAAYLSR